LLLLIGAALCFVGAFLSTHYGQDANVLLRTDVARLQALVIDAEITAEKEADEVAGQLQQGQINFSSLVGRTTYPCFIFRGEQLLYWSDHTMRPEPENLGQHFEEKLVDMKFGRFLAMRRAAGAYVILTYVPLEKHYGISNRYLKEGEESALFQGLSVRLVAGIPGGRDLPKIYSAEDHYLFSVESLQANPITGKYLPLALLLLGFALYLLGWLQLARRQLARGEVIAGAAAVVVPLTAFRVALLYFGLPFSFIEVPLFDPRVYAASWLAPSLGDLLINAVLLLLLTYYGLLLFRRYGLVRWMRHIHGLPGRSAAGGVVVFLFLGLLELLFQFYANSFNNSQLVLDITQNIQISGFKLLLCLAIVLHTGGYLVGFYVLSQLFIAIVRPSSKRLGIALLSICTMFFLPVGVALEQTDMILLGLTLLFFFVVRLTGLRQLAAVVPYQIYLFIFLMLGVSSAVGALALYEHFDRQLVLNKQKIAGNLLVDNDLQGEYLLAERTRELAADPLIRSMLASPFANQDMVRQKIVKYYLRDYFDKYEIVVSLFDPNGKPVEGSEKPSSLYQVRRELLRKAVPTDQPNLYLVRGSNSFSTRRYVAFVRVPGARRGASTVLLELSLKKLTAYSVVPELLVDQKFFQPNLGPELSYAGYENGRLVYNEGDFDYGNKLSGQQLLDPRLYTSGLSISRFHHLAVRGPQNRTVVVTTATYSFSDWLANFSFLFLLHTFFWLLAIGLYMLARGRYVDAFQTNFSTKIQLFLNFGILVPLVIVSVATASQVTSSYKRDLRRTYERRGKAVQENLLRHDALLADSASRAPLIDLAENVSGLTETDLNLYDAHGQLLVSSQPLIFESGLLSPLMNPQAVAALAERGQPRVLLTERAGSLSFNALYLPLHAMTSQGRTGAVAGYVGIPFFDSEKELDNKLIELISTILNIFTVMFILFLVLTFVASRLLTNPLKVITEKLKHTTLTGQNEMLAYESSDEIGLLVREYNAMLLKLEESKQELATQEKEAAWREMARQVAHEIKNPLTPMKLSLQFLQKAIAEQRPNVEELIGKISQTLITQVDVLNDIATSFSNFTNLPAMRPERLDVAAILRRCVALHQGGAHGGTIHLNEPLEGAKDGRYLVFADENLLVRTFNNLLINALQSVPASRQPAISAAVDLVGADKVRICIEDNGAGIPAAVRDKIFVPNFTTKESGSGIGLAVARRGIESAGGHIWFETEEGVGTKFFIELPLAPFSA